MIETNEIAYSDEIYFPESILTQWLNLSAILLTCSLLFYHMSHSNTKYIKIHPYYTKIISIGLFLSTGYMINALYPYISRMNHNIKKCKYNNECS